MDSTFYRASAICGCQDERVFEEYTFGWDQILKRNSTQSHPAIEAVAWLGWRSPCIYADQRPHRLTDLLRDAAGGGDRLRGPLRARVPCLPRTHRGRVARPRCAAEPRGLGRRCTWRRSWAG